MTDRRKMGGCSRQERAQTPPAHCYLLNIAIRTRSFFCFFLATESGFSWSDKPMPEPITFEPAPEAEAICKELVEDHHQHLVSRKLKCIFRSVARIKGGNTILATIQLLKGKNAFLANMPDPTMLIDIAMDEWAYLDDSQRIALMDHELCHAIVDPESGEVKLRGHDVEEFIEIINRRGFWEPGLERLGRAAKNRIDQYKLFTDEEPTRLDIPSMLENEYEEAGKGAVTTIVVKLDNVIVKAFDLDKPKRSAKRT